MSTAELKLKLFRQINSLDSHKDEDGWESLSEKEQKGIEAAILELESGQRIKHDKIISKYRKKYSNA